MWSVRARRRLHKHHRQSLEMINTIANTIMNKHVNDSFELYLGKYSCVPCSNKPAMSTSSAFAAAVAVNPDDDDEAGSETEMSASA
jgi:hypothetical protein